MRALAYIRVSTLGQAQDGVSLDQQRAAIEAYCASRSIELIAVVRDAGVSGHKLLERREGGRRLLRLVSRERPDAVLVYKLDRAFRNTADCLTRVTAWERLGVALHLLDLGGQPVDTSTAIGKLMLTMLAAVAEMERNLTAERTRAAMQHKVALGEKTGGDVPFGYRIASDGRKLVPSRGEQKIVAEIVRLRAAGLSLGRIAAKMNEQGIPTKRGRSWYAETVKRVIDREARVEAS